MRCLALALATLLLVAGKVWAGEGSSDFALENGFKVRLVPMSGDRQVAVVLGVRAGFLDEPAGLPHIAHITEHLVVFGHPAGSDDGEAVARWFRQGRANGETLPGWMYFDLQVDPAELEMAVRVQAARLARPEFTEKGLAREVPRALDELAFMEQSKQGGTGKFAYSAFVQAALYGRTDVPIKAASRAITLDDVRRFHAATFRPDQAILVVVGGFDPARARSLIEKAFGPIAPGHRAAGRPRPRPGVLTARWDASTRHLIVAWPTPATTSPDHAALSLAVETLDARLRADAELARRAKMPLVTNDVDGLFLVNVQAKPGADLDALRGRLLDQVARLNTPDGLAPLPLLQARMALGNTIRPGEMATLFAPAGTRVLTRTNQELQRLGKELGWGDLDAYARRANALDAAAVRAAVANALAPGKAVVVRVEPSR